MKVRIAFTVDVDPEQWMELQACETRAEVREDVQRWARDEVLTSLSDEGVLLR